MKKYNVTITETLSKTIEVEAESKEEAEQLVNDNWRRADDKYILSSEDFNDVNFTATEVPERLNIRIYQIDMKRDTNNICFMRYDNLKQFQGSTDINSSIYAKAFEGEVDCKTLEDVYTKFNTNHPKGYTGRSLSVSDIIEIIKPNKDSEFYFCDSVGFKKVDFNPSKTINKNTIKIVILEPEKAARITEIEDTLEQMQSVVGGNIEPAYFFDEPVAMIVNEEGKIQGLPLNRAVYSEPQKIKMSLDDMFTKLKIKERDGSGEHINGYVTFTADNFNKPYSEESRTYCISSDNKAFQPGKMGYSMFACALDGSDSGIRIDQYISGENPWKIEKCYLLSEEKEMVDIIAGTAFICGVGEENFRSLTDEEAKKYVEKFKYPERFFKINGQFKTEKFEPKNQDIER